MKKKSGSINHRVFSLALLLAGIFLVIGLLTIKDYGISWDETIHFRRGQAYIHYFLTGQKSYVNVGEIPKQGGQGDPKTATLPRRSLYQNDHHNTLFFLNNDRGHPPINDEIAAFLNLVLYQKLGIVDDISSYQIFNVIASSLLVFIIVYFMLITFGKFASIISFLTLVTYPLFFAESHFNIKDPPQSAFFAATILCIYLFHTQKKLRFALLGTASLGLSLGTKFNVLFLPVIIGLYFLINWVVNKRLIQTTALIKEGIVYLVMIIGAGTILVIFWPYLWADPIGHFRNILNYYQSIGTGTVYQPQNFIISGFNSYPLLWILFTTPPIVLGLTFIGVIAAVHSRKKYSGVTILWLIWMIVPITRVMLPNSTVYGGVRQILEFLPAMALLTGLGADRIVSWFHLKFSSQKIWFAQIILIGLFLYPIWIIVKLHPHQNLYFNSLIGGLEGASKRHFPATGNSFGNAYKMGIDWINRNAETNAKLALIQGTPSNLPPIWLRSDIRYLVDNNIDTSLSYFSGISRLGEYIMELTPQDSAQDFYYTWDYVNTFLKPVYELKVEGVVILKIWKNDLAYTKHDYKLIESAITKPVKASRQDQTLILDLGVEKLISKFIINFDDQLNCQTNFSGRVSISQNGSSFNTLQDVMPQSGPNRVKGLTDQSLIYYIAGKKVQYIAVSFSDSEACPLRYRGIEITELIAGG